jgi:hypothetical protein
MPPRPFDLTSDRLGERIVIHIHSNDRDKRVQLGTALPQPPPARGEFHYENGAIVPGRRWRDPSREELGALCPGEPPPIFGNCISIVRIPDDILAPFAEMTEAAGRARTEDELFPLMRRDASRSGTENFIDYARATFRCDDEPFATEGGIFLRPAGLPTVTTQGDSRLLIGLHLDSWYNHPVSSRRQSPNRICVNLGCEPRAFLFLDRPIASIYDVVVQSRPDKARFEGSETARKFVRLVPDYPIVKLLVWPGEAYIAPTENVVHDASSLQMATVDVTLSIRGRFHVRAAR